MSETNASLAVLAKAIRMFLCSDVEPLSAKTIQTMHHMLDCVCEHLDSCSNLDRYYSDLIEQGASNDDEFEQLDMFGN